MDATCFLSSSNTAEDLRSWAPSDTACELNISCVDLRGIVTCVHVRMCVLCVNTKCTDVHTTHNVQSINSLG